MFTARYVLGLCIYLRTNSDLCHLQHKLIGFYNWDEKCLQYGTYWVFKLSGLRFVFKWLNPAFLFSVPTGNFTQDTNTGNALVAWQWSAFALATVAVEKQYKLHILLVLLLFYVFSVHSACALLHCHLCPIWLYITFPHHITNSTNFDKALEHKMRVLTFFTIYLRNISHSKKY